MIEERKEEANYYEDDADYYYNNALKVNIKQGITIKLKTKNYYFKQTPALQESVEFLYGSSSWRTSPQFLKSLRTFCLSLTESPSTSN